MILVDARKGLLTQTRRHSYLVSLVGIRHVVLAINKMDLVDYSRDDLHSASWTTTSSSPRRSGLSDVTAIPLSALNGDNMHRASANTPWYTGPTLMGYLETVQVEDERRQRSRSGCRCSG